MGAFIYIAEDDNDIAELLEFNLINDGYEVKTSGRGDEAYSAIIKNKPDLLILDLNLPGMSGIEICKYIRETPSLREIPIIMLTARSQETDKVLGLKTGADDYVTKPFSIKELTARVDALLRRTKPGGTNVFKRGKLEINFDSGKITYEKEEISLTPTEFKLLTALIKANGRVLSRRDLLEIVWGLDSYAEEHTVNVNVKRLRDKLLDSKDLIKTVKGIGYRFE